MLDIDDEKLPPPTPAKVAMTSIVLNDTPGSMTAAAMKHGTSSSSELMIVQFRPPILATANVYGSRSSEPAAAGRVVIRNF
jgi:hypothetical protein